MKELMAELLECTCLQQGREALAETIIEKHVAKLFLAQDPPVPEPAPIHVPEPIPFVPGKTKRHS